MTRLTSSNIAGAVLLAVRLVSTPLMGEVMSNQDTPAKEQWVKNRVVGSRSKVAPFSFEYGGNPDAKLLDTWSRIAQTRQLDAIRKEYTVTWRDRRTGLEIRYVVIDWADFPVVEWTVYFKNRGRADTPILANIQALDIALQHPIKESLSLHYIDGDGIASAYAPRLALLQLGTGLQFSPSGGRPTSGSFPYYNLEWSGQGMIIAVGWSGQWASSFARDQAGTLRIRAGQELTHLKLHPGEEIRSPMIVQLFWKGGDWIDAQNLWRRWMRAHNSPKPGGKDVAPILAAGTAGLGLPNYSIALDNENDQNVLIRKYAEERLKLNYWWMDIYNSSTNFWMKDEIYGASGQYLAGSWDADRKNYPNGLRGVSDYAHSNGLGLIVWYEPEHVWPGYQFFKEHPEWLLSAPADPASRKAINQGMPLGNRRLLNLGNPAAVDWLVEHFSQTIKKEQISVYRQDFNIEPLVFWRNSDAADRQGSTENLYVQGYLRFWDGLLEHDPYLLIDTCASGGRRNDIETLRRSVPLWRSDDSGNPVVEQNHTYGLALWIPYFGSGVTRTDAYAFRSVLGSSLGLSWDLRDKKFDYDNLRALTNEFWGVAPYFIGDYYPLTQYTSGKDDWIAWQFNRPEQSNGVVQAFFRDENNNQVEPARNLHLRGLDSAAMYEVTDLDTGTPNTISGKRLMQEGLQVKFLTKPGAAVITYKKVG
jgi:alpha-galactosidase